MPNDEREITVDYSQMRLPFGPVHPALKEPFSLNITIRKEEIVDVELRLEHVFRGIEKLAENRNLIQAIYLLERICGICSHTHTTCFIQALEEIGNIEISPRASYLRTLIFELERIHSHLLFLGLMAQEIGFDTLFMYAWNARETILDLFEEITGNRIHHAMNVIGGVRWDLATHMRGKVLNSLRGLETSLNTLQNAFQDKTVEKRLCGVGQLDYDEARNLGVVGPVARASGVNIDVRKDKSYLAYKELKDEFSVISKTGADAYARTEVRILELFESVKIIRKILDTLPNGPISTSDNPLKLMRKIPDGEAISIVEAPRGKLLYFVRTDGKGGISQLKVRTPTLANVLCLKPILIGGEIADIPVVVSSIDPCISCGTIITTTGQDSIQTRLVELERLQEGKKKT